MKLYIILSHDDRDKREFFFDPKLRSTDYQIERPEQIAVKVGRTDNDIVAFCSAPVLPNYLLDGNNREKISKGRCEVLVAAIKTMLEVTPGPMECIIAVHWGGASVDTYASWTHEHNSAAREQNFPCRFAYYTSAWIEGGQLTGQHELTNILRQFDEHASSDKRLLYEALECIGFALIEAREGAGDSKIVRSLEITTEKFPEVVRECLKTCPKTFRQIDVQVKTRSKNKLTLFVPNDPHWLENAIKSWFKRGVQIYEHAD